MALTKYKLGDLLELCEARNDALQYTLDDVKGISIQKIFIETKADMAGVSLRPYYLVQPDDFAYVTVTSRNGEKITLAHNTTDKTYIVSSSYVVFRVKEKQKLLSDFLFMYFNRPEFDRFSRFNSWGSARETFSWEDMCDMDVDLPPLAVQQKYVDVYNAMLANQKSYERGLDDLKLTCDAYIEALFKTAKRESLGKYIQKRTEKNSDFSVNKLLGVGMNGFIEPRQEKDEANGHICYLIRNNDIVFAPPQVHRGSIALYKSDQVAKCSDAYVVFCAKNNTVRIEYVFSILKTPLFQKYAYYYRDGVREQFDFDQLSEFKIPVPSIEVQTSIMNMQKNYLERKSINEKLKTQIKDICPILIKGSIEEAKEL